MPIYQYLQLQPIDPRDDGTISDLDVYDEDETIDLSGDTDGEVLMHGWDEIEHEMHDPNDDTSNGILGNGISTPQ